MACSPNPRARCARAFAAVLLLSLAIAADRAVHGSESSIRPARMPQIATVDARFQSYNVEMVEVTGGRFWRPYASSESAAQKNPEQHGMGATITTAWLKDSRLSIAHVGDSRAYLLRSGNLQQLTNDHSLVAEQVRRGLITPQQAEESEMQSVLLRALGAHPEVEIDMDEVEVFPRDILLMCSDGLTRMVTEPEIAGTLQAETTLNAAAERLIALANENGGIDNITVIVVRFEDDANKGWFSWMRRGSGKKD